MRLALLAWLAVFFAGCSVSASALLFRVGNVSGESCDPSQCAKILASSEPSWLVPVGVLGAILIASGAVGATVTAVRAKAKH